MSRLCLLLCSVNLVISSTVLVADDDVLHTFRRVQLTDTYYSEGANLGDLNNDGAQDVVYGPFWFAGPDFQTKHEIYRPVAQPTEKYADNFFSWVYDFNGDGWRDVLTVGFPGTPAHVYENPGNKGQDEHWRKHEIFDWVSNESPQFTNLVGDERPELVCSRDGYFGYITPNWETPFEPWQFHRVSAQVTATRFGHGLGVGDVNGDGRLDLIAQNGWYAQPASVGNDPQWRFYPADFATAGGADMFAYDVDGDGDNDVITSLDAHNYGLAWYEQVMDGDNISFTQHTIMGSKPSDNKFGVLFTEPHSVNLADIDGDGLKDICTGKTYYSHHQQSPMWDAGAVVYWFQLQRTSDGVDWIPHQADGEAGIGRQLVVDDVNGDQLPDFVTGGMKGCHVLLHESKHVDRTAWLAAQPSPLQSIQAGLSPADAAENMTVPAGFQVQLAAGEPLVHQPIAFTTDHRGRLWVAEAYTYPQRAPDGQGRDKIIILEDTDQDGTLDSRTVFAEGLNLVSGIEVGFGGVWVGAAPYFMFIPDANGDDRPDSEPQILLDGFGYQDTHEVLNSFIWGPDGWLYGCHGVFTHSRVGKPGTPDAERTPMNAAVWRYHPTRHEFDVFMNGTSNPWGVDFNDHGHAFITACVIPHLFHVVQGARYQRQGGQHFNSHTYDDIKTIADHAHYAGDIRDGAWWGKEPELTPTNSAAGGGHAHCGAMIYLGDNWPEQYRNSIYFHNVHGNRVNNDILRREGSGYVGSHGKDFLFANDQWFRGINLKYGPDGAVHLIDWYDKNACHRSDPEIWDRSNGRIYRVSYGDTPVKKLDLSALTDLELAQLQASQNEWHVRTARRLLQERGATRPVVENARKHLRDTFRESAQTTERLRALWAIHVIGDSNHELLLTAVSDRDENVRGWGIQLLLESRQPPNQQTLAALTSLSKNESSPLVRLYLAAALQRAPLPSRWSIAENLMSFGADADDHNLPLMIWYGVEPLVPADPSRAMRLAAKSQIPLVARFITRRAAASNESLDEVIAGLSTASSDVRSMMLDEMLNAFEGRVDIPMPSSWNAAYATLLDETSESVRDKAARVALLLGDKRILPRMRELVVDSDADVEKRLEALNALVRARDDEAAPALFIALEEQQLRGAAIRALSAYNHPDTAKHLLDRYESFGAAERRDAINTLTARPATAMALLDAVERGQVLRTDVHAYNIRQLSGINDNALRKRLESVWGKIRATSADKKSRISKFKSQLTDEARRDADLSHGRVLFDKTCASCHRLFGEGGEIGPDITGSNRADLDYILENAVDPSAVVSKDYQMSTIHTEDGRAITGLVLTQSDSAVTIRTVNDTIVVAKSEIEDSQLSELSLMPEGQLDQLSGEELRDLIAYLASPTQVDLPRIPTPIDVTTGKVPDGIEGESMKVIGKTAGDVITQSMSGFKPDKWSGDHQLWWTGQSDGAKLDLEFSVATAGTFRFETAMTCAHDYGIVQFSIDGELLGNPIDNFHAAGVISSGLIVFDDVHLAKGTHRLSISVLGRNRRASNYMFGLDFVRLVDKR